VEHPALFRVFENGEEMLAIAPAPNLPACRALTHGRFGASEAGRGSGIWRRAFTLIGLPLAVVLALIAIAFGISALLAGAILLAVSGFYAAWRDPGRLSKPGSTLAPGGSRSD
jgi:hypothetical protein